MTRSVRLWMVVCACTSSACFDLFHRTHWASLCDDEPHHPDCAGGGAAGGSGGGGDQGGAGAGGGDAVGGGPSTGSTGGSAGSSGSGGGTVNTVGCSDGAREGFPDSDQFAEIAACSGGWSVVGVLGPPSPSCSRAGGDDGVNPVGTGCSVSDLCAIGWHLCATPAEVGAKSATGCGGLAAVGAVFFVIGQSGPGLGSCGKGANDLFGCGSIGGAPAADCAPLDKFSGDLCAALGPPWDCGLDALAEAQNVTKGGADLGGALCCRD